MKILVIDDDTLTIKALYKKLVEELPNQKIKIIKINRTPSLTRSTSDVKEFYGTAQEVTCLARDANILIVHKAPVTREVINHIANLKLIACARNNPVNVDINAAKRRGITVINAPGRASVATAEFTICLMLALTRKVIEASRQVKSLGPSAWNYAVRTGLEGIELKDKTAGIIGFGRAGKEVAARLKAFGMNILVYSTHSPPEEIYLHQASPATLEELLANSDFVTLHSKLTDQNVKLIGREQLKLMKKDAYLINTARGKLIDEQALFEALSQNKIKGAALDVMDEEPPLAGNPLLYLENVIITPHLGGKTKEAPERSAQLIVEDIKRFLEGKKPVNLISI